MATSEKKVQANQRNAKQSTGPRSKGGKAKASRNALKHGFLSVTIVLPDEKIEEFDALSDGLHRSLCPVGALEEQLVNIVAMELWRLCRVYRVEASILKCNILRELASSAEARARSYEVDIPSKIEQGLSLGMRASLGRTDITDERAHSKERGEAARLYKKANEDSTLIGDAFLRDANGPDGLAKLSRYGAAIQRNLFRAIHQLERLQAPRRGQSVSAPVAMDVDISVSEGERRDNVPVPRLPPNKGKSEHGVVARDRNDSSLTSDN